MEKEIDEITAVVINEAIAIHRALGPGLLESVYETVLEIKSLEQLSKVHGKQLLTYLRLTHQPVGLLLNFSGATLKERHQADRQRLPAAAGDLRVSASPRESNHRRMTCSTLQE